MLSERQFNRQAMQNKTQMFSQGPPTGGWNTRDDVSDMDPKDAAYLENWFPDTTAVRVRNGCRFYDLVVIGATFETLAEFNSEDDTALIVAGNGNIAVTNDHVGTLDAEVADGFVRDEWQTVN